MNELFKNRWFAALVNLGLLLLLYFAAMSLAGNAPPYGESDRALAAQQPRPPIEQLPGLFAATNWPNIQGPPGALNVFYTRHFIPAPVPAPPAPSTRKIEVTYLGFYQAASGPKQALVRLGDSFCTTPVGARLVTNVFIAQATMQSLLLTNTTGETNLLTVNVKKTVEVPIK